MIKWWETTKGQTELRRFKSNPPPWGKKERKKKERKKGKEDKQVWQADNGQIAGRASKDAKVELGPGLRWAGEALGYFSFLQEMLVNFGLPLQLM